MSLLLPLATALPSDAETSDEEYVQDEEAAEAGSDQNSDLDEMEGEGGNSEEGGAPPDDDNPFSDDDDLQTFSRPSRRNRVLDSDDEDSNSSDSHRPDSKEAHMPPPVLQEETCSMSIFNGDTGELRRKLNPSKPKIDIRRPSVLAEEASMPPLFLNESFESESSESQNPPEEKSQVAPPTEPDPQVVGGGQPSTDSRELPKELSVTGRLPQTDIGVGESLEEENRTQLVEGDSNSLESNFQWSQVLPPAQPRKDGSLDLLSDKPYNRKPEVKAVYTHTHTR